jgi:hypothetical protein
MSEAEEPIDLTAIEDELREILDDEIIHGIAYTIYAERLKVQDLEAELAKYEPCVDGFCTDETGDICHEDGKHLWARGHVTRNVYHKEEE